MATVAPVLSTDNEYTFQQFKETEKKRPYLENCEKGLMEKLVDYYGLEELSDEINQSPYKKITLQFPDELVADSALVLQYLQKKLPQCGLAEECPQGEGDACGKSDEQSCQSAKQSACCKSDEKACNSTTTCCKSDEKACNGTTYCQNASSSKQIWILADTAYSACCVDEVAAEHVKGDCVVHFGDACLNAIQNLPVYYTFGKPYLNHATVIEQFKKTYSTDDKVVLMADTQYTRHLSKLHATLVSEYPNVRYAEINLDMAENATIIGDHHSISGFALGNRVISGDNDLEDHKLFHITEPKAPHLLFLSTKFSDMTIFDPADGSINQGPFPSMMKRYKFMHVARTAGTIGILVNTLSLRHTKETINKLGEMIKNAGKKHYMFVVGKPNVAKLANFESIDIWCVLGCGQSGIIVDQYNEFFKPIVTPYELTLALNQEITWTGQWVTAFSDFLEEEEPEQLSQDDDASEDEAPEFNPVTGQYVSMSRPLRQVRHLEIEHATEEPESNALVKKFSSTVAIKGTVSTSAIHLQNRQWTGLGSDFQENDDDEGAEVEEGRSGVARGYEFDRSNVGL